jgi:hypothetical protein
LERTVSALTCLNSPTTNTTFRVTPSPTTTDDDDVDDDDDEEEEEATRDLIAVEDLGLLGLVGSLVRLGVWGIRWLVVKLEGSVGPVGSER